MVHGHRFSNMDKEWHNHYELEFDELSQSLFSRTGSHIPRDREIYPYMNCAGEVDKYRLVLTVNDLCKSFLTLNDFLEKGSCYYLS